MVRTDAFIRTRRFNESEVMTINLILKNRARKYIAAPNRDWLFPEDSISSDWENLKTILLPPENEIHQFGGEMCAKYNVGSTYYQDSFGRTVPEYTHLNKKDALGKIGRNAYCPCGSGRKYKKCCMHKRDHERTTWKVYSIRERNLILCNGIESILGLNKGKSWEQVRRELSNEQIKDIYSLYGSLWPIDTDIFSLLPKLDQELRALYIGVIDPRAISFFAIGATPYFDQILIQHPFVHPDAVNPEFSPVESPHQYKQQTLKNMALRKN